MPHVPGTCEKCGAPFIRMNKRRKYCTACQIIRDADYRKDVTKKCDTCERAFYPVRLSYATCNHCRELIERPDLYPACKGCGKCNRPAPEIQTHCMSCVQGDPVVRKKYINRLRRIVADRTQEWLAAGCPVHQAPKPEPQTTEELF